MNEARVVEVRTPDPTKGYGSAWVKMVRAVAPRAKTGHDWDGDFLRPDTLQDLPQGTLLVSCGNRGSRKHSTKYATLWVVIDEDYLVPVETVVSNEWAIELRDTAQAYLSQPWRDRCQSALLSRLAGLEETSPQPSSALVEAREWAAKGWRDGWSHWIPGCGMQTLTAVRWDGLNPLPIPTEELEQMIAERIADAPARLAQMEREYTASVEKWQAKIQRAQSMLAQLTAEQVTDQVTDQLADNTLATVPDDVLVAECRRRGLLQ